MPNYVALAATAARLITKNGRDLTFLPRAGVDDANKPWRGSTSAPAGDVAKGVVIPKAQEAVDRNPTNPAFTGERSNQVLRGFATCYTTMPTGITSFDEYVQVLDSFDNSLWSIVGVDPINPGDTVVMYEIHLSQ